MASSLQADLKTEVTELSKLMGIVPFFIFSQMACTLLYKSEGYYIVTARLGTRLMQYFEKTGKRTAKAKVGRVRVWLAQCNPCSKEIGKKFEL